MLDFLQHPSLIIRVFDLLHLYHLLFLQDLDGIEALVVLGSHKVNTTKASCSKSALNFKVR